MMNRQNQNVFLRSETQQCGAQQQVSGKIEGPLINFKSNLSGLGLPFQFRRRAQIDQRQINRARRSNNLYRLPLIINKMSAQRFMTANRFRESLLKRGYLEFSAEPEHHWNVVQSCSRGHLLHKPETLLRKGK